MTCRTGCPTQDHTSWGECARASNIRTGYVTGWSLNQDKAWHTELDRYRSVRKQGIQPASTRTADIIKAEKVSDAFGKPYDAGRPAAILEGAL